MSTLLHWAAEDCIPHIPFLTPCSTLSHPSLCLPLSVISLFLLFTMYHYCVGLTQGHVSCWLRAINYLAKRSRVLARVFPSTPATDSTLHPELFTSALSCPWLQTCRAFSLLDIDFQPKMANKALAIAHTRAGSFWFNFCLGFMLFSLGQPSKEVE